MRFELTTMRLRPDDKINETRLQIFHEVNCTHETFVKKFDWCIKYDKVNNEIFFPYKRVIVVTQLAEIIIVIGAFCVTILTCPVTITKLE